MKKYELYNSSTKKSRTYKFASDDEAINHIENNVIAYDPSGYTVIKEGLNGDNMRVDFTSKNHDYVLTRSIT